MFRTTTKLALLGVLTVTMVTGCSLQEDRTPTYRVVGWKYQVENVEPDKGSRDADRYVGAVALDQDTQVVDGTAMLEVDFGSNGYEVIPMNTNALQNHKDQIEAKMVAEGDYDSGTQHLVFYQTTNMVDLDGAVGIRFSADAEDISVDRHGIDPGDMLTFAGTSQTDLDDASEDLEDYGVVEHAIVPVADFDVDDDGDVDLFDYAAFQEAFTGPPSP